MQEGSSDESPDLTLVNQRWHVATKVDKHSSLNLQHPGRHVDSLDALYNEHSDHDNCHDVHEGVEFESWTECELDCQWN